MVFSPPRNQPEFPFWIPIVASIHPAPSVFKRQRQLFE